MQKKLKQEGKSARIKTYNSIFNEIEATGHGNIANESFVFYLTSAKLNLISNANVWVHVLYRIFDMILAIFYPALKH